jgi:hypothetical protein
LGVWVFRSLAVGWAAFNYLFLVMVILAVGFGYLADRLLSRFGTSLVARKQWLAVGCTIVLVHGLGIWAAVDSRVRDVQEYRALYCEPLYRALSGLRSGERVLVVGRYTHRFHGIDDACALPGRVSALAQELDDRIVRLAWLGLDQRTAQGLDRQRITLVLDVKGPSPVLMPLEQWRALSGRTQTTLRP